MIDYVYAIDINNMEAYSENYHYVHNEVWKDKGKLIEFLTREGLERVELNDRWHKGREVYRWSIPEEYRYHTEDYEGHIPFDFDTFLWSGSLEVTILKLEVR